MNEKQKQLKEEGLQAKEIANVALDKRRNKDLEELKKVGGLFITVEEINQLMEDANISEEEKQKRLYREIRCARDTALSISKSSDSEKKFFFFAF